MPSSAVTPSGSSFTCCGQRVSRNFLKLQGSSLFFGDFVLC